MSDEIGHYLAALSGECRDFTSVLDGATIDGTVQIETLSNGLLELETLDDLIYNAVCLRSLLGFVSSKPDDE